MRFIKRFIFHLLLTLLLNIKFNIHLHFSCVISLYYSLCIAYSSIVYTSSQISSTRQLIFYVLTSVFSTN